MNTTTNFDESPPPYAPPAPSTAPSSVPSDDGEIVYVTISRLPISGMYGITIKKVRDGISFISKIERPCSLNIGDCIVSINNHRIYMNHDYLLSILKQNVTVTLGVIKIRYIEVPRPTADTYGLQIQDNNKIVGFTTDKQYQLRIGDYILFVDGKVLNHEAVVRQFKTKDTLTLGIIREPIAA